MSKKQEFLDKVKNGTISAQDLFLMLDVMEELSANNADIKELLEDLKDEDDIIINFKVNDKEAAFMIIKGKLSVQRGLHPNPTVKITMDKPTALGILTHKISMMGAYKEGKIIAEGKLIKLAGLAILMNIVGDELGII